MLVKGAVEVNGKLGHHWSRKMLVACSVASHHLNESWLIIMRTYFHSRKYIWECRLWNGGKPLSFPKYPLAQWFIWGGEKKYVRKILKHLNPNLIRYGITRQVSILIFTPKSTTAIGYHCGYHHNKSWLIIMKTHFHSRKYIWDCRLWNGGKPLSFPKYPLAQWFIWGV